MQPVAMTGCMRLTMTEQEQQRLIAQAGPQLLDGRAPGHGAELALQLFGQLLQPAEVERFVAGNPEQLFVEGGAQGLCGALQLLLVELQGDRLVEQLVKFAVQPLEQLGATDHQFQQGFAQFRGVLLGGLGGQQLLDIGGGVADFFPLLAELELVQADVGDFVREVLLQADLRQGLLLLVEDSGQQQAALEDADLLLQRLVALVDVVL